MKTVLLAVGYTCLCLSTIGLIEILLGLIKGEGYNLLRAIVYSILLGIGFALI